MPDQVPAIRLDLPWPPTVNHYWISIRGRNGRQSRALSNAAKNFRRVGNLMILEQIGRKRRIKGPVSVTLHAHVPDRRKRDLDNVWKGVLDLLAHAGIIEDDSQMHEQHGYKLEPVKGGRCVVEVTPITTGESHQ